MVKSAESEVRLVDNPILSNSQNFLRDSGFVVGLLNETDINKDDLIIEIGPGTDIITRELASRAGQVIAVEVDSVLATKLQAAFAQTPNVTIVKADFLHWRLPVRPYKVFANIPFDITADIVTRLLESNTPPEVTYLIMQDEAAERFVGSPSAKNTQVSILMKPWFDMRVVVRIDREQFRPIPNVDAVLAMFRKRKIPLVEPQFRQSFQDFVVYGYNQWASTVLYAFRDVFSKKQLVIIAQSQNLTGLKPSDLTINQWIELFDIYCRYVSEEKKGRVRGSEKRIRETQAKLRKWHRTRKSVG